MYVPVAFRVDDVPTVHEMMRSARLAHLVTAGPGSVVATPLPLMVAEEGALGTLYGHVARANDQWRMGSGGEGLAIFMGAEAYVSPSFYPTKRATGMVVPTWNYIAVHAYGPVEFFEDASRLLDVVTRLTDQHERARAEPWAVDDAPKRFVDGQLKAIVGVRMPITRLEGKRKLSQNRTAADQAGVAAGLAQSDRPGDREIGRLIAPQRE
jgi:transcriptional regulator